MQTDQQVSSELLTILADELNVREIVITQVIENGLPSKQDGGVAVALDVELDDELIEAGRAREFLRQIQQLRKNQGLNPGQTALLIVGPTKRSVVEPLLINYPDILADAFISIDPDKTWAGEGSQELKLDGETLLVDLQF